MAESTRLEPPVSGFTEAAIQQAIAQERRRCVGLVLSEFGVCKLAGAEGCARILVVLQFGFGQTTGGDDGHR